MSDSSEKQLSPASIALMEAIDADIAGHTMYPDRATFIDAEQEGAGKAQAAAEGRAVVLCSEDGTRQVLYPSRPAAA